MRSRLWLLIVMVLFSGARQAVAATEDAHGIDFAAMDTSIRPGADFNRYANGRWQRRVDIPADRPSVNTFSEIAAHAEQRSADLIRDVSSSNPAAGSNARRIADYYAAFMDQAGIEARGLAPIRPALAQIDAIASRTDLARVLGSQLRADVDPLNATHFQTIHLFGLFVAQGLEDPSHNVAYLLQGGIDLPSRDYYLSTASDMVELRAKYLAYIAGLLELAHIADADARARAIVDLETRIAAAQATLVDSQDVHKANNPWPMATFATKAPGLDWDMYFKSAGLDRQPQIIVWQPDAIAKLSALAASEPLQTWKDYLTFQAIDQNAAILPSAFDALSFEFHEHALEGTPRQRARWKRAISMTSSDLADAVGQLYVARYFPASSKAQVQQMVDNLLSAFDDRIDSLDWMTPATRQKAKAKIATLRVGIGYPDSWRDDSALEIRRDDPIGNHQRAEAFEYRHQLAKLDQPVNRDEWWMSPQSVNAVNLPLQNALIFPAAILDHPFFDPAADAASNYGAIGAIIGHEISHSFDRTGAEFDADGRLANWWTAEDLAHFRAATAQLVAQYSAYEALPGLHVNGEQTSNENIADVSGLTIAYAAYHKSLAGKPEPVIRGIDGDQRFFIAFAQSWKEKTRDAAMREQVSSDPHSPPTFRAQTVRNLDGWYQAFAPAAGDALYLDPTARIRIW